MSPDSKPIVLATPPEIYAEAVHRAVCEFSRSDGFGHCFLYTIAGWALILRTKPDMGECIPQAGGLALCPDPDDPTFWFGPDAEDGGMDRGEFHTWLTFDSGIFVDFSARHYARYVNISMNFKGVIRQGEGVALFALAPESERVRWNRPAPPTFLWAAAADLPEWVCFRGDQAAFEENTRRIIATKHEVLIPLGALAWNHFERLRDEANGS